MALKTAGTKTTTSLQALQWQPGGLSQTDLAALNELIKDPNNSAAPLKSCYIENGILFLRGRTPGDVAIPLAAGDWICVDGAGWVIVIPNVIFSTSWQHS